MTMTHLSHAETRYPLDPAVLADAAYRALLRHELGNNWLDIQLELWRAMTEKVRQLEQVDGKSIPLSQAYPKLEPLFI